MLHSNEFRMVQILFRYKHLHILKNSCRLFCKTPSNGENDGGEGKNNKNPKQTISAVDDVSERRLEKGRKNKSLLTTLKESDVRGTLGKPDSSKRPLNKKISASPDISSTTNPRKNADEPTKKLERRESNEEKVLGQDVVSAADAVAKILGGATVKSDILKKLMNIESESASTKPGLKETLSSMTLTKNYIAPQPTAADEQISRFQQSFKYDDRFRGSEQQHMPDDRMRRSMDRPARTTLPCLEETYARRRSALEEEDYRKLAAHKEKLKLAEEHYPEINLLYGPRLNIFDIVEEKPQMTASAKSTWEKLDEKHIKWLTTQSPRNGFEEMIKWTEEGKVFPYPIDNEFGFYEKHVGFHEHVFLDHLLKDGFPRSGPIRSFMELVVVGLSKNPYMAIEKKLEHIDWYRKYFHNREEEVDRLKELDREEFELKKLS